MMSAVAAAVVAGTMFNIVLLIAALRMICRRCASQSERSSEQGQGQQRAQADVEAPRLKQPSPTVVLQPDNQVSSRSSLVDLPVHRAGSHCTGPRCNLGGLSRSSGYPKSVLATAIR